MKRASDIIKRRQSQIGVATREEALWTCPECGVVEPIFIVANGRYIRRFLCPHKQAEKEAQEKKQALKEQREALEQRCYAWLGRPNTALITAMKALTFENYNAALQPEAFALVQEYAQELSGNLVLHGTPGTGKTHLLAALANAVRTRGIACRFMTALDFFEALQAVDDSTALKEKAIKAPLLIIDDVDKAKWSEFREETYFKIINARSLCGLPTAISTNRLDALKGFIGIAADSRLAVGRIEIEMTGKDYRGEL